jgi:serine/threonine protein kinase
VSLPEEAEHRRYLGTLTLPYENLRTIHAGGSEVRKYRNELTGQFLVGKRVGTIGLESTFVVREATLLQQIRHDNLVPVFDVVRVTGLGVPPPMQVLEIVMPFYERGSVCDAFSRGHRFTLVEARDLALAALRGLSELHDRRILHRDVKTPNLLLTGDTTRVKLGDLGVAVPMDRDGTADVLAHSPQLWTAPETYTVGRIDCRADLYSMGIVLHEVLSCPLPYEQYPPERCLERLSQGRPAPAPRDLAPDPRVPRSLRRVVTKATRTDPAGRYRSAHDMADALAAARLIDWIPVVDGEDRRIWEGRPPGRRNQEFQVEVWRTRRGRWKGTARRRGRSWRRIWAEDQELADGCSGSDLATLFDRVVDFATR